MRRVGLVVIASVLLSAPVVAQSDVSIKPGTWGIETSSILEVALLHFGSPSRAARFAVSARYEHIDDANNTNSSGNVFTTAFRVGVRSYRGATSDRYKPFTTVSLLGGYSNGNGFNRWQAGVAADLGASYFFSPHVSLGGFGEVSAAYEDIDFGSFSSGHRRTTSLGFNGFRMVASVLF